jgi:membrane-bound metal-dependent hydrolase YbcI (DUF457 family)
MYAVGHLALGYLSGKAASKILSVDLNLPLIFLISVLPDIDLILLNLEHRGPLHSIIVFCLLFIPIFTIYRKKALPYFVALIQHNLIGDYLTGGTQLFWPLTTNWYGSGLIMKVTNPINILAEWILFLFFITIMFKTKDVWLLLQKHSSNMILVIPVLTVLLPAFLSFPLYVPTELIIPHLTYITLFTLSIVKDLTS